MKVRIFLAALIAASVVWAMTAQPMTVRADGDKLEEAMESLKGNMRKLRSALEGDSSGALDVVARMQKAALAAKSETPGTVSKLEGKAKEKMATEYRVQMIDLATELLALEKALVMGDQGKVKASYKKLGQLQKKGHDRFREKKRK